MDLWYDVEDGYLELKLDDGSVLLVAASWEGVHVLVEPASRLLSNNLSSLA